MVWYTGDEAHNSNYIQVHLSKQNIAACRITLTVHLSGIINENKILTSYQSYKRWQRTVQYVPQAGLQPVGYPGSTGWSSRRFNPVENPGPTGQNTTCGKLRLTIGGDELNNRCHRLNYNLQDTWVPQAGLQEITTCGKPRPYWLEYNLWLSQPPQAELQPVVSLGSTGWCQESYNLWKTQALQAGIQPVERPVGSCQ